jgi:hypothetical protein
MTDLFQPPSNRDCLSGCAHVVGEVRSQFAAGGSPSQPPQTQQGLYPCLLAPTQPQRDPPQQPPGPATALGVDRGTVARFDVEHSGNREARMLPLYAARIEDLGPGDFVKVNCAACHHVVLLTARVLIEGWTEPRDQGS